MNIQKAIADVRSARELKGSDEELNHAVATAFNVLTFCTDADQLRDCIPPLGELDIPTRLIFAMHVQVLVCGGGQDGDRREFAAFLDLYYEEWSDWANALRANVQ